jgi:hypothetical protein
MFETPRPPEGPAQPNGSEKMKEKERKPDEPALSEEELDEADGEELPDREAMSVITPLPSEEVIYDTPGGPPDSSW